jgi:hypothetical protein
MNLRDYLTRIGNEYDRSAGLQTPTQQLLRAAPEHVRGFTPAAFAVIGSGGKGSATYTPWFGFFDPDETTKPEKGIYVVYIFGTDLLTVALMLLQGITELSEAVGNQQALVRLARDAEAIRAKLPPGVAEELDHRPDLGPGGYRQRAYEAGCIYSRTYAVDNLPRESDLRRDLGLFFSLYGQSIAAKRDLLQRSPGTVASASVEQTTDTPDPLRYFKPKDDSDYVARLSGRVLVKSRRHERLVRYYGEWLLAAGFDVFTDGHPRDLVARRQREQWLVEAKILYQGNATNAVRSALGQLYTYRHFLYPAEKPHLVALFSEDVGEGYTDFLEEAGVASVWYDDGDWHGSASSVDRGVARYGRE